MKILRVVLDACKLDEMRLFYTEVLEMNLIKSSEESFTVQAGETELVFNKSEGNPFYHVSFRTNEAYYEEIFTKLNNLGLLLGDENGQFSLYWKGKQAYFTDPDGNILEMLEREYEGEGEKPRGWYDVNEVGMPVRHIGETQAYLSRFLNNNEKAESDTFAFYGDHSGCLVLVKERRHWYPTKREATIHPIELVVSGKKQGEIQLLDYPYVFKVKE